MQQPRKGRGASRARARARRRTEDDHLCADFTAGPSSGLLDGAPTAPQNYVLNTLHEVAKSQEGPNCDGIGMRSW